MVATDKTGCQAAFLPRFTIVSEARMVAPTDQRVADVADGSIASDAFRAQVDQCPLLLQSRHYCSAQRSVAKGQKAT
jgi:hypothetical protein